jgi:hypothetical protein
MDADYVKARNRLIPIAEKHANKAAGKKPINTKDIAEWSAVWNQAFCSKMERLAFEKGLAPWMAKTMKKAAKHKPLD